MKLLALQTCSFSCAAALLALHLQTGFPKFPSSVDPLSILTSAPEKLELMLGGNVVLHCLQVLQARWVHQLFGVDVANVLSATWY